MEKQVLSAHSWVAKSERTVKKGEWKRVPTGVGEQFRMEKVRDIENHYDYAVNSANDRIMINGNTYVVEYASEWAIKIMKTKIKANGGAKGLMEFLNRFQSSCDDGWELKILENCNPEKPK